VCSHSQTSTYYGLSDDCFKLFIFTKRHARLGQKFCRGQKFCLTSRAKFLTRSDFSSQKFRLTSRAKFLTRSEILQNSLDTATTSLCHTAGINRHLTLDYLGMSYCLAVATLQVLQSQCYVNKAGYGSNSKWSQQSFCR